MKKFLVAAAMVGAGLLTSCGGSTPNASESTMRTKNEALPTTVPVASTLAVPTTIAASTSAPATTSPTTSIVATTSTIAVPSPTPVVDPGGFAPTYLASTDAAASPRPAMPAEASVAANAAKAVSSQYRTDASGTLTVATAEWVGSTTPMTLRWNLTVGSKTIPCDNCAFVTTGVKKMIKAVLAEKLKGTGITSVRGFDPSVTGVGAFSGNGWSAEFLVGDPASLDSAATGNSIRDWVLGCTGSTASTCRNVTNGIGELRWKNQVWSVADCKSALQNGGPRMLMTDLSTKLKGASTDVIALVRQRAALDRVSIALPLYRPTYTTSGTSRVLAGFASTGCAQ